MTDYVIITGASKGLGLAISQQAAAKGYAVIAIARQLSDPSAASVSRAR
jgi:3-oxoacyl-[acyl-carrier protein] reductase